MPKMASAVPLWGVNPQVMPADLRSMVATDFEETPEPQTLPLETQFEELKIRYDDLLEENVCIMLERDAMGVKFLEMKEERNLARHEMHRGWADSAEARRALAVERHNNAVYKKRIRELEARLNAQACREEQTTK